MAAEARARPGALLAALVTEPELVAPLRRRYRDWQKGLEQDSIDPARAAVVRLAADGLWMSEMLGARRHVARAARARPSGARPIDPQATLTAMARGSTRFPGNAALCFGVASVLVSVGCASSRATSTDCHAADVGLQVLGSGGPIPDDERASSGYLVWVSGESKLLVEVGGGVFQRFGAAGARIEQLDAVAVTHLHADHVADLPAMLKGGYFADRTRPLPIIGPSGNAWFPAIEELVTGLLDPHRGSYRYLSGYLDGSEGRFHTPVTVVDADRRAPVRVYTGDPIAIDAVGVKHGRVPAVGYLVTVAGRRIAFSGDQSADNPAFAKMIRGADVLVMHHAIPESARALRHLHATPSEIGAVAGAAKVGQLVLSHHMLRAMTNVDQDRSLIGRSYAGPVHFADDLECFPLDRSPDE